MRIHLLLLALLPTLSSALPAAPPTQAWTISPGTIGVVTTEGFYVPNPAGSVPRMFVSAASISGQLKFAHPAIQWERGTNSFLISTGPSLYRLTIDLQLDTWTAEDITPASSEGLDIHDIDVHPGTGQLFLLEQNLDLCMRFTPPFAAGMLPDLLVPVPPTSRSLALDSRSNPMAVVVGESTRITRVELTGETSLAVQTTGTGLDVDPQDAKTPAVVLANAGPDIVARAPLGPNAILDINKFGGCTPFGLAPRDVEWDAGVNRAFALAEDGINNSLSCNALELYAPGPNHILKLPVLSLPPNVVPERVTSEFGSGIQGEDGDLAVVTKDFAFVAPIGVGCAAGQPSSIKLNIDGNPTFGTDTVTLKIRFAPPNSPATIILAYEPGSVPLPGGCELGVEPLVYIPVGTTNANGALNATIPFGLPAVLGADLWFQASVNDSGVQAVSNALLIHFGL